MGMQLGCHEMGQPFADPCARSLKLAGWLLLLVAQPRVTAPLWLVTIALCVFCTGGWAMTPGSSVKKVLGSGPWLPSE
jgi:hypothetical protein